MRRVPTLVLTTPRRSRARAAVAMVLVSACVVPLGALAFADGPKPQPSGADAMATTTRNTPPDPPAMSERKQWVFDLRWDRGEVFLVGIHPLDLGAPQATPRAMGRFALELYEGPTLIERARFDFPLLGPPETDGAVDSISAKLKTRIGVMFPATHRGTRLELWDRATQQRWTLPWPPPEVAPPATPKDAGADG